MSRRAAKVVRETYMSRDRKHAPLAVIEICECRACYFYCKFINRRQVTEVHCGATLVNVLKCNVITRKF